MNKKNRHRPNLLNQKGSSSILLVVIMVTLLSLGVLSVASSYSNYRIAQKNASWNTNYYAQDADHQSELFKITEISLESNQKVDAYLEKKAYLNETTDIIPMALHKAFKQHYGTLMSNASANAASDLKRARQLLSAQLISEAVGMHVNFDKAASMADSDLKTYYQYTLQSNPKVANERRLSVIVSLYGDAIDVVEYREIPARFTYKEIPYTDIKEQNDD